MPSGNSLLRSYGPAWAVALLSVLALMWLDWSGRAPGVVSPLWDLPSAVALVALVPDLAFSAVAWQRLVHRRPWREAWHVARHSRASTPALLSLAIGVLLTRVLLVNAVAWKYGIPLLGGFRFDVTLHHWDTVLHDGEPWRLLSGFLQWPILWTVDQFYALWYFAFAFVVIREAWRAPDLRQQHFFTAMALVWIVGAVVSVLFASAGPVYFVRITGEPGYAGLTTALAVHPLLATQLQHDLWRAYQSAGSTGLVKGIAAFPSLHVAMPALYAVSTWTRARRESWLWWAFTAATLCASVVLGWHYAVDGYAAILIVAACWWLAGRVTPHCAHAR